MTFETPLLGGDSVSQSVDLKTISENGRRSASSALSPNSTTGALSDTIQTFSFDPTVDQKPVSRISRNALITNAFIGMIVGGICGYTQFELTNNLEVDGFEDFADGDKKHSFRDRLTIFWVILICSNFIIAIFEIIVLYLANAYFFMKLCEAMGPGISKSELLHDNLLRIAFNLDFKKKSSMGNDPEKKLRKCNLCIAGILYRFKVQTTVILVRLLLIFSLHRSDVSKNSMWVAIPLMIFWDTMLGWKQNKRAKAVISSPRIVSRFLLSLHEFYQNEYCAEHNIDAYCKIDTDVLYPSEFRELLKQLFSFFPLTGRQEVTEEIFVYQMRNVYQITFPREPPEIDWAKHLHNITYHKNKNEVLLVMKIVSLNLVMRPFISSQKLNRYREACMAADLWHDNLGFGPLQRLFDVFRDGRCSEIDILYLFDRHYQQQYSDSWWRSLTGCCESFFYKYTF